MSFQLDEVYVIEPNQSRVTAIRLLRDGKQIFFQVEGSQSLIDYYGPGGEGHDHSFWIQSVDGKVEFPVASATDYLTEDSITFNVPPEGRQILRNIGSGDRFIFAVTAPSNSK